MAKPEETRARFAIFGDDLDPDEITALMGCAPSSACRKGDLLGYSPKGAPRLARTGKWSLKADPALPGNLDRQILDLLAPLPTDPDLWRGLTERFKMNVFCGIFMEEGNVGCALSPETLLACGLRGLLLDLDIYAPTKHDEGDAGGGT